MKEKDYLQIHGGSASPLKKISNNIITGEFMSKFDNRTMVGTSMIQSLFPQRHVETKSMVPKGESSG